MAFDVDRYRAANQPWSVRMHGRTYTARWISGDEILRYAVLWSPDPARGADEPAEVFVRRRAVHSAAVTRTASRLMRDLFPWRPSMLLFGDPVALFRRADEVERLHWLRDFFAFRAAAIAALQGTGLTT